MAIKDLIPWNNKGREVGFQRASDVHPFLALHREMNRMFDEVFRGFDVAAFGLPRGLWMGSVGPRSTSRKRTRRCASPPSCPVSMRRKSAWKSQMAFCRSPARRNRSRKTRPVASANGTMAASNGAYRRGRRGGQGLRRLQERRADHNGSEIRRSEECPPHRDQSQWLTQPSGRSIGERPDDGATACGRYRVVKQRRSEKELRQMMLAAARQHVECSELEDLFIFGSTPRPGADWALVSQARRTRFLWPATRGSIRSPVSFRKNMNCIRSKRAGAISKQSLVVGP